MKFYSDIAATLGVWNGSKMLTFEGGVYETDDPREIELLKNAGYRHDEATPPAEEQKSLDIMSYNELKDAAKVAGIKDYNKMKREQLIEALKG